MPEDNFFYQSKHRIVSGFRKTNMRIVAAVVFLLLLFGVYYIFARSPKDFPLQTVLSVNKGVTVDEVASFLKEKHFVVSGRLTSLFIRLLSGGNGAIAGDYYFPNNEGLFYVSLRIARGMYGIDPVRVTIPEGSSVRDISKILDRTLPKFDSTAFLAAAKGKEGYLFPDTYNLLPVARPADIVMRMEDNFNVKIKTIETEIEKFGKPLKDVLTMASILEGEARQTETRRIVAGILWKRIKNKMPLQVDATFEYINGKNTSNITLDDLQIDSPYNTYVHIGLPPTPISNPGLDSILAAVTPIETKYLYFLTDKNGVMHYAATFDEHQINKRKYLQ